MLSFMPALFSWGLPALAVAAAVAAFVFAPVGSKRTLIEIALAVGLASAVYGHGATYEQALCKAEISQITAAQQKEIDAIRIANANAMAEAQAAAHAKADQDAAALKSTVDALDAEADADQDAIDQLNGDLAAMVAADPKAAAAPAPPLILRAIRGNAK